MGGLSEQQLAEIQAREAAATEGPWEPYPSYGPTFYGYLRGEYLQGVGDINFGVGEQAEADLAFVLAAREDVPALLARIAELEAERRYAGRLEAEICQCQPECEGGEYLHEAGCPVVSIQMQVYGPAVEGDAS